VEQPCHTTVADQGRNKQLSKALPQYDDDEAFENGVLRDRARYRLPMHA
jgi:hypothetical protein